MLGEDDELLAAEPAGIGVSDFPELLELGFVPAVMDLPRQIEQCLDLFLFGQQIRQGRGDHALKKALLGEPRGFSVLLVASHRPRLVVSRTSSSCGRAAARSTSCSAVNLSVLDVVDQRVQLLHPALERAQERIG